MLVLSVLSMLNAAAAEGMSAEVLLQESPQEGLLTGVGARLSAEHAFASVEGRTAAQGLWIGRATGGVDLISAESVDLTVGLFLGTTGDWAEPSVRVAGTAGFELGLGGSVGPLHLRYRHADGFRGPLEARLTEDELRLGWRFFDTVEVFGQYVRFNPDERHPIDGYGAGLLVSF